MEIRPFGMPPVSATNVSGATALQHAVSLNKVTVFEATITSLVTWIRHVHRSDPTNRVHSLEAESMSAKQLGWNTWLCHTTCGFPRTCRAKHCQHTESWHSLTTALDMERLALSNWCLALVILHSAGSSAGANTKISAWWASSQLVLACDVIGLKLSEFLSICVGARGGWTVAPNDRIVQRHLPARPNRIAECREHAPRTAHLTIPTSFQVGRQPYGTHSLDAV